MASLDNLDDSVRAAVEGYAHEPSRFARHFFLLTVLSFGCSALIAWLLFLWRGQHAPLMWGHFPVAFLPSTAFLVLGSSLLHWAFACVRREETGTFRRLLTIAVVSGIAFVGWQIYGLASILRARPVDDASTGVTPFVFMLAALHGLHFTVAQMFLIYVTIKAHAFRYDHEYFWGVQVCVWFWHALGVIWLAILTVFVLTAPGLLPDVGHALRPQILRGEQTSVVPAQAAEATE